MPLEPLTLDGFTKGQSKRRPPFIIQGTEFQNLVNMYPWRERLKSREPAYQIGRLRRELTAESLGNSGASPWSFNIFTLLGVAATEPEAEIEVGSVEITIAGPIVFTDQGDGTLSSATPGNSGTIDYYTGAVTLTHTAGAGVATTLDMNYFPTLPVMGIDVREDAALSDENTLFFDTKYCYQYNPASEDFEELPSSTPTTWSGSDSDFFWLYDYFSNSNGQLTWATNFSGASNDPIRYYDGTTWTNFTPILAAGTPNTILYGARIILPFKGSLLMLNTIEGDAGAPGTATQYPNRLRYSFFGNPLDASAFRSDIVGKGGFNDAPTNEHIVSAFFVRDILIVAFERSTWTIRFTGNPTLPFVWVRTNSELGAESTFAKIGFDGGVLNFGSRAITLSDGNSTRRIDEDIPNQIFQISNRNQGPQRVQGVRDYFREIALWSFTDINAITDDQTGQGVFPNQMLVYNYLDESWANFTDHYTALGPFQSERELTWDDLTEPWYTYHFRWGDPQVQRGYPGIAGGNQQGFVMGLAQGLAEGASLTIQGIGSGSNPTFTSVNHNLPLRDIVEINGVQSSSSLVEDYLNGTRFRVIPIDADTFNLQAYVSGVWVPFTLPSHTYISGGAITRCYNFELLSKQFNLLDLGKRLVFNAVDFQVNKTESGQFAIDFYTDYNPRVAISSGSQNFWNTVLSTSGATLTGSNPDIAIRTAYANTIAQFFQMRCFFNDSQMVDPAIQGARIEIYSITLWVRASGKLEP